MTARERLRAKKDVLGWRPPWHLHFKTVANGVDRPYDPSLPPLYTVSCAASECAASGCPQTESGFPMSILRTPNAPVGMDAALWVRSLPAADVAMLAGMVVSRLAALTGHTEQELLDDWARRAANDASCQVVKPV